MSNLERAIADRYAKLTGDPNNDIQPVSKEALIGVIEQMTVPQPFQYQGSKRALAPLILQYLPISTPRLVEPFCGSAAGSRSAAVHGGGFKHRPGARFCNWRRHQNSRRDAAATRRRGRLRYE
jgi:hypothetical protein